MARNSGPGYAAHPEHTIALIPHQRVRVTVGGEEIASSTNAIRLNESRHPPVYYIPRADVRMERLERSTHKTYCPFKGDASYFSIVAGAPNAVWSYESPYDEVAAIKEHIAFYPDKVDAIEVG